MGFYSICEYFEKEIFRNSLSYLVWEKHRKFLIIEFKDTQIIYQFTGKKNVTDSKKNGKLLKCMFAHNFFVDESILKIILALELA